MQKIGIIRIMPETSILLPGERICQFEEGIEIKSGAYVRGDQVFASMAGKLMISNEGEKKIVEVKPCNNRGYIPYVGCHVTAQVVRVTQRYCKCKIIMVNSSPIKDHFAGLIRKEDVRATECDKVEMEKCFRPGDVVMARVISINDALAYILSTAENELGVVAAKSESGDYMIPISWIEMACLKTSKRENRKVAKIQTRYV